MEGTENSLEQQFGFTLYTDDVRRPGWLLNYTKVMNPDTSICFKLYFIDDKNENFAAQVPYYPSFLVETTDFAVEELFNKRYEGNIHKVDHTARVDTTEFNHLNTPRKQLLKIFFKNEATFEQAIKETRKLVMKNKHKRNAETIYLNFGISERNADLCTSILNIHEYDIPSDVELANTYNVRCGKWHSVSYIGEEYIIESHNAVVIPDLRILAYDIETTKPPLKFPDAETDQIMMISIKTDSSMQATKLNPRLDTRVVNNQNAYSAKQDTNNCQDDAPTVYTGELIINREIVSEDIEEFEYSPKSDMLSCFQISNEGNEEELLVRFIEIIHCYRPHIITTYNGAYFDFPFVEKRLQKYNLSFHALTGIKVTSEYHSSPFIIHLDCYKWVKRDSYLPMGSQGLKSVTKAKLGYFPDEVDPEEMVYLAKTNPQILASYSVSDSVATYYLYVKYIQPYIFSLCTLIPLPPVAVLCKGSGFLCESLLISEAMNFEILIPKKRVDEELLEYQGRLAEHLNYVGGHVECLRSGVFRADFKYDFKIAEQTISRFVNSLEDMLSSHRSEANFTSVVSSIATALYENTGSFSALGAIYHLDVGAMYPNIILTNKLQPISVVNEDICIRCDYSNSDNRCKKEMEWELRAEYYPLEKEEINMLKNQLEHETFYEDVNNAGVNKIKYSNLPDQQKRKILKSRVIEYSKQIYKRTRITKTSNEKATICQREVPFYVETVRKFRDQRYVYKKKYLEAQKRLELADNLEGRILASKEVVLFNSLQVAHKVILNSFYGYTMRKQSRWFSMEMAAVVCNVGSKIIRKAKELVSEVGIALELDTDGIWCIIPSTFPTTFTFKSGKKVNLLSELLNHFVCKEFTNHQYQIKNDDYELVTKGKQNAGNLDINTTESVETCNYTPDSRYIIKSENSVYFEIDGPYKAMIIPSSVKEGKLLKKRYVIINYENKISELKGFEFKRRGELKIIKKFQEDLFEHFLDGSTLKECYESLAKICNYWMDMIQSKGSYLTDEDIFDLFSESRNMSKDYKEYLGRKSNITNTAARLAEFLGENILAEKLKCEFIVSVYPENQPIASRTIPVLIFKFHDKDKHLKKWLGKEPPKDIRQIIDWKYYASRFESVVQKIVALPAMAQGLKNPIPSVTVPIWISKQTNSLVDMNFKKTKAVMGNDKLEDIEDIANIREAKGFMLNKPEKSFVVTDRATSLMSDVKSEIEEDMLIENYKLEKRYDASSIMGEESAKHKKTVCTKSPHDTKISENLCNYTSSAIEGKALLNSVNEKDLFRHKTMKNCVHEKSQGNDVMRLASLFKTDFMSWCRRVRPIWLKKFKNHISSDSVIGVYIEQNNTVSFLKLKNEIKVETKAQQREVILQLNSWDHFSTSEVKEVYFPDSVSLEKVVSLKLDEKECTSSLYKNFLCHPSIRKVYEHQIPLIYQYVFHEKCKEDFKFVVITAFNYNRKVFYAVTREKNFVVFCEENQRSCANYKFSTYIETIPKRYIIVLNELEPSKMVLGCRIMDHTVICMQENMPVSLGDFDVLCKNQRSFHLKLESMINTAKEISTYTSIPVFNVIRLKHPKSKITIACDNMNKNRGMNTAANGSRKSNGCCNDNRLLIQEASVSPFIPEPEGVVNILDLYFYKTMRESSAVVDKSKDDFDYNVLCSEFFTSCTTDSYVIGIELIGTLILSIIEYKCFLNEAYDFVDRKDFLVLRTLLKKIMLDYYSKNTAATYLLSNITRWLKFESNIINDSLMGFVNLLQQKYIIYLVGKLNELKCKIICVSREILFIDTEKKDLDGSELYFRYLISKVKEIAGYELLCIRKIKHYQKLAFVSPSDYFFLNNGDVISHSLVSMPADFLKMYFDDNIEGDLVYRMMLSLPLSSSTMILELLSYKEDKSDLLNTCMRLLKINDYYIDKSCINITIVCSMCGYEGYLRNKCFKCCRKLEDVDSKLIYELRKIKKAEATAESYCNKCNGVKDKKLSLYCKCGGFYVRKSYLNQARAIANFSNSQIVKDAVSNLLDYFMIS